MKYFHLFVLISLVYTGQNVPLNKSIWVVSNLTSSNFSYLTFLNRSARSCRPDPEPPDICEYTPCAGPAPPPPSHASTIFSFFSWIMDMLNCAPCFSADGLVQIAFSGGFKRIDQLKSGDHVLVTTGTPLNQIVESEIMMISHSSPDIAALFIIIETETGEKISLSGRHLIPISSSRDVQTVPSFIYAEHVTTNDYVYIRSTAVNGIALVKVRSLRTEVKMGFYSPITKDGTIIVNNGSSFCLTQSKPQRITEEPAHGLLNSVTQNPKITASVYASINNHQLAHVGIAPLRWYYTFLKFFSKTVEPFKSATNGEVHWTHLLLLKLAETFAPQLFV
ncbi:unnamed protein product [Rotaria magnacalcarata]|uniref:Hint domain-containing protein n=1 Tax=Rotaria magnacalcarata TaxID=392030 RepID=A0A815DLD5_9BILA|nr:unnamed protein product [Rotaria magnacalcarata]